jgi:hypothetical protein
LKFKLSFTQDNKYEIVREMEDMENRLRESDQDKSNLGRDLRE